MMQYNDLIKHNLSVLVKKYKKTDVFKTRAYSKALMELPNTPICSIEDVENVGGAKIQLKLKYLLENNKNLEEVDEYLVNDTYAIIDTLQTIHGIGPAKAKDLYDNHNIRSIEDLRNKPDLLNNIQHIGLKFFEHIIKKIPYKEMQKHEDLLRRYLSNFDFTIAGSYRRKAPQSSDIDILLTGATNQINDLIDILKQKKYIDSDNVLAHGGVKFMGLCKLPKHKTYRRIDILYTPPHEYPFALLYFTGNFKFNVDMRRHASSMGLSLNEQSLTYLANKQPVNHNFETEKDIFDYLNYSYVEPEYRSI